jgi:hypothetical protein
MSTPGLAPPPPEIRRPSAAPATPAPSRRRPVITPPRVRPVVEFGRLPVAISALVHLVVFSVLAVVIRFGPGVLPERPVGSTGEAVEYIDLAWPVGTPGDGAGLESSPDAGPPELSPDPTQPGRLRDAAPLLFPGGVTSGIPAPAPTGAVGTGGGGGAAPAGPGGVGDRLRPGFRDPRLYVDQATESLKTTDTRSQHEIYMEHLTERIRASNDSMGIANREPNTDWTLRDGQGRRWGLSEDGLHLGPLTVPKELVPRPTATGDNRSLEAQREQQRQREEIQRQEDARARRAAQEEAARRNRERAGQ